MSASGIRVACLLGARPLRSRLVIGSFCSIGSGAAFIMAGNQGHRADWTSAFPFYSMSETEAFAGARNGFEPAGDTVIGTRALVTRDVEPYAVLGGNPARAIRKRFDEERVRLLLEMKWWDWPDEQLAAAMKVLTSGDVEALHRHWLEKVWPEGFPANAWRVLSAPQGAIFKRLRCPSPALRAPSPRERGEDGGNR